MLLTQEQTDFYKENGYLIVDSFISYQRCDHILKICEEHADKDYRWLFNLETDDPDVLALVKEPKLVTTVKQLLKNHSVHSYGSQVVFKKPGTIFAEETFLAHQDNYNSQSNSGVTVSVFICLERSCSENGGLFVYPRSHEEPILPHDSYNLVEGYSNRLISVPSQYNKINLTFGKGAVYFQHGNLIHGSYPNKTDQMRPIFEIMYVIRGEYYKLGKRRSSFHKEYLEKVKFD